MPASYKHVRVFLPGKSATTRLTAFASKKKTEYNKITVFGGLGKPLVFFILKKVDSRNSFTYAKRAHESSQILTQLPSGKTITNEEKPSVIDKLELVKHPSENIYLTKKKNSLHPSVFKANFLACVFTNRRKIAVCTGYTHGVSINCHKGFPF